MITEVCCSTTSFIKKWRMVECYKDGGRGSTGYRSCWACTLPETKQSKHLEMDGWKTTVLFGARPMLFLRRVCAKDQTEFT